MSGEGVAGLVVDIEGGALFLDDLVDIDARAVGRQLHRGLDAAIAQPAIAADQALAFRRLAQPDRGDAGEDRSRAETRNGHGPELRVDQPQVVERRKRGVGPDAQVAAGVQVTVEAKIDDGIAQPVV